MEELIYRVFEVVTDSNGRVLDEYGEQVYKLVGAFLTETDAEAFAEAVFLDNECYIIEKW